MNEELPDDEIESEVQSDAAAGRMRVLSETYEAPYLADVRLRFGLREIKDRDRLVILEQHPEARRPWCEAMMPFVVNNDFLSTWRALVESVWGHPTITSDDEANDVTDWVKSQGKSNTLILSHVPPISLQRHAWPPPSNLQRRRGLGWAEAHQRAQDHPYRALNAQQLATLIENLGLEPVNLYRPSMVRYLVIQPGKTKALVFRETDPPGRFAGILKRSNSNLVKK